jgi:hypothetical protein
MQKILQQRKKVKQQEMNQSISKISWMNNFWGL